MLRHMVQRAVEKGFAAVQHTPVTSVARGSVHVLYHKASGNFQYPGVKFRRAWLARAILACFSDRLMALARSSILQWLFAAMVCALSAFAGCYVGYHHETEHWTAADTALGEEHEVPYAQSAALPLIEDALRGDGILFERQPDDSIVTLWRDADFNTPTGWFPLIIGVQPRYRYEIQAVPESSHKTKIIVNVRTEGI